MRYFPVCLHVVGVINSIALTQQRRGEEGYLNNPMTTVTQTEAVDRGMKDSSGKKETRTRPLYVLNTRAGGRERRLAGEKEVSSGRWERGEVGRRLS